jgi:3-oxoacyl-[acyl-carrier protein] reductase
MSIVIDLNGQTALVTGSSQGIGAATIRLLHRAGARVVINHPDRSEGPVHRDALSLLDELLEQRAESATVRVADVSDPGAVQAMMQSIRDQWQGIDILVNNAGILRDRTIAKMSLEEWRSVVEVDLSGVFYCCKFGLEILRDGGSIVSVGSLAAKMGFRGQSNYAAAKAGVLALTRVLARECAPRSIRVNAVAPGVIDTPLSAQFPEAARNQLAQSIALQRWGRPEDVAGAILFLCSPLARYITGHVLEVDGGFLG